MMAAARGWYIARLDLTAPHAAGVARKIGAQIPALLSSLGNVDLLAVDGGCITRNGATIKDCGAGRLGRLRLHYYQFYLTISAIKDPVDFVYIRYQRTSPVFLWMLATIKRRNPRAIVLVELPSFPYHTEEKSLREKLLGLSDRFFRVFLQFYVDRIVTFSRQEKILGISTIATDNGADVDAVGVLPKPESDDPVHLLALANLSFWHGYDRVISGLADYRKARGSRRVVFDIVGVGNELERLKNDARRFDVLDMVVFHGAHFGEALTSIMSRCHVGISSIGMHRLDVDTSNLKSREFTARGLPFVLAYTDRDFVDSAFCHRVPENDTPVDIAALIAFYDRLKVDQPDYSAQMRCFAEERLTWEAKLEPVVREIRALLASEAAH